MKIQQIFIPEYGNYILHAPLKAYAKPRSPYRGEPLARKIELQTGLIFPKIDKNIAYNWLYAKFDTWETILPVGLKIVLYRYITYNVRSKPKIQFLINKALNPDWPYLKCECYIEHFNQCIVEQI